MYPIFDKNKIVWYIIYTFAPAAQAASRTARVEVIDFAIKVSVEATTKNCK